MSIPEAEETSAPPTKRGEEDKADLRGISSEHCSPTDEEEEKREFFIPFELHQDLIDKDIVTRYDFDSRTKNIVIELKHVYKSKKVNIAVKDYSNVSKLRNALKKFLVKEKGIQEEHAKLLAEEIDNNADMINDACYAYTYDNDNGYDKQKQGKNKELEKEQDTRKASYLQRYRSEGYFAEAVLIGGISKFLVSQSSNPSKIEAVSEIEVSDEQVVKPYEPYMYINKPYSFTFTSKEDLDNLIEQSKNETLDSLYRKNKTIWRKYIDGDNFHISISAADEIFTYFQELFGLTHYLFYIGDNNAGKSNNLTKIRTFSITPSLLPLRSLPV